jgi:hypothetical protein
MTKRNKTWGIEEETASRFEAYCEEHGLIQAAQVEKMVEKWLEERQA